jgi:hypothetical protein
VFVRRIRRTGPGRFELSLSAEERGLLRELPVQLASLLANAPDDPSLRRLFPPAYADDPSADAEYQRLMHAELAAKHRDALALLAETAGRDELGADELHAWLAALNDLRLALGTRLGVTEELYEEELDADDPAAAELRVYLYLTWLQEQVVEAAADDASR